MVARKKTKRGFTLIEVLMVLVIIGLLAGVVGIVAFRGTRRGAEIDTAKNLLRQVATALERYNIDVKQWPSEDQGLGALVKKPTFEDEDTGKNWRGPYLNEIPKDPWNNELVYRPNEQAGTLDDEGVPVKPYVLFSKGPDGNEDTDDDIKLASEEEDEGV